MPRRPLATPQPPPVRAWAVEYDTINVQGLWCNTDWKREDAKAEAEGLLRSGCRSARVRRVSLAVAAPRGRGKQ
jgi:hypothetical protein